MSQIGSQMKPEENSVDILDPESHQIREVYARFGLAMYQAQCLERTLAILMATVYGPGPQKSRRTQYDALLESNFRKTLGSFINQLRKRVSIAVDLELRLSEALEKRNWLAHNYFWERAPRFMKEEGRESMIKELQEIADYFAEIDSKLTMIVTEWGEKHGITEEVIQQQMETFMNIE